MTKVRHQHSSPTSPGQHSDVLSFDMEQTNSLNDSLLVLNNDAGSDAPDHPSPTTTPPRVPQHTQSWTQRYLYRDNSLSAKRPGPYVALPMTPEEVDVLTEGPTSPWLLATLPPADPGTGRYAAKAAWLMLLLIGYACTRATVWLGIPADGNRDLDPYDLQDDMTKLFLFGFVLDWFARISEHDRFYWLFSWRRWYFFLIYLGTPPVYGIISDLPGLQHSFGDISQWGAAQWGVVLGGVGALLGLVGYHVALAVGRKQRGEAVAYVLSRCCVYIFFILTTLLTVYDDSYHVHLHHLYLGWAFALFAEFNTPLSALTLAITTGIFVQGIGAYSFADNVYNANCFTLNFGQADAMACQLGVPHANVSLRVCPVQVGVHVDAQCTVPRVG